MKELESVITSVFKIMMTLLRLLAYVFMKCARRTLLDQDTEAFAEYDEVQEHLNDFYMSRIGIRLLIGQVLSSGNL